MIIEEMIEDYIEESEIDFVFLAQIATNVQCILKIDGLRNIIESSMKIVRALMERGIFPLNGAPNLRQDDLPFWLGTPDELAQHIEDAWVALNRMPDVEDICWFARRPSPND